jgi:hypothetical protein
MDSGRGRLLTPPEQHWECPNCDRTSVTRLPGVVHQQLHPCPGLGGIIAPYVEAGTRAKVTANVREDFVRHSGLGGGIGESLTYDDRGRPITSVSVERDSGVSCVAYVPCIEINLGSAR